MNSIQRITMNDLKTSKPIQDDRKKKPNQRHEIVIGNEF